MSQRLRSTASQKGFVCRQALVIGLVGWIADAGLCTPSNLCLVLGMDAIWEAMWYWCRFLTREFPVSALRMFFMMHVILVQIGLVTIYVFAQKPTALARLYLDFSVRPSLQVVLFPSAFMLLLLAGVATIAGSRVAAPTSPPTPAGMINRRRAIQVFSIAFVWGAIAFYRVGFPVLSSLGGGSSAEDTRLAYHYGERSSLLFNSSIVAQTYVAIIPFAVFALWRSSRDRSLRRMVAYAMAAGLLFLVANSLERTTPAILAVWFALAGIAVGKRPGKGVLLGGPAAFLAVTLILHGSGASFMRRKCAP